jgi:Zn-dependent protease
LIDLTLQQLLLRFCALLLIASVHGAAVAGAACALGDQGPRYDGRLRLNPFAHLDLLGAAAGVLFLIGWIRPITIDPARLRFGRMGLVLVLIAATAAVLVSVVALRLARPIVLPLLGDTSSTVVFALIETIGQLGIWFVLINLVPIPPLTGGYLLTAIVPEGRVFFRRSQPYTALLLAGLAATGAVTSLLGPAYRMTARLVLGE